MGFIFNHDDVQNKAYDPSCVSAQVGDHSSSNTYFNLSERYSLNDLDAPTVGPVIEDISHAFDDYWNNDLSYPGLAMSTKAEPEDVQC